MGLHLFVIVFLLLRQKRISYFMGLSLSVYKTKDKIHYLKKIQSISTIRLSMPTGFSKRIFPFYERHRVAATQWGDTNEPFLHDRWWVTRRKEHPLPPDRNICRRNRSRRLSSRFPVCSANLNTGDPPVHWLLRFCSFVHGNHPLFENLVFFWPFSLLILLYAPSL